MNDIINILLLSFAGSVLALIGGIIFLVKKSWSNWLSAYSVPFAAGVLLTVSLLGLLPESIEVIGEKALLAVLLAFLGAHFFEQFFFGIHHHEGEHHKGNYKSSIPLIIAGDTIHNFIDGIVIAAAYLISPGLGVIATVSTFLHEVPHEIGDFGILLKAGWKRGKILIVNILSALTTILGALFVIFFTSGANGGEIIGYFLAISAGLFLYLGASDFLPHIHQEGLSKNKASAALLIGFLIMVITIMAVPHSHGEGEHHDHELHDNLVINNESV